MKLIAALIILFWLTPINTSGEQPQQSDQGPKRPIETNEVVIDQHLIRVPIGEFCLVRKDSEYCAVKFLDVWWTSERPWENEYAIYESYYQGDKSGDLLKENVQYWKEESGSSKRWGAWWFPGHGFQLGSSEVRCGPIRLSWSGAGFIYFNKKGQRYGDYGIELAPSKWSDISEVNVFDPRLKWYRYDESRKQINIPIDQLWEEGGGKK